MSKTVIPKMVEDIIEELKDVAKGNYSVEDIVSVYDALEQINTVLDELTVLEKPPYVKTVKPLKQVVVKRGGHSFWTTL